MSWILFTCISGFMEYRLSALKDIELRWVERMAVESFAQKYLLCKPQTFSVIFIVFFLSFFPFLSFLLLHPLHHCVWCYWLCNSYWCNSSFLLIYHSLSLCFKFVASEVQGSVFHCHIVCRIKGCNCLL